MPGYINIFKETDIETLNTLKQERKDIVELQQHDILFFLAMLKNIFKSIKAVRRSWFSGLTCTV